MAPTQMDQAKNMQASFSILVMSIASTAAIALGVAPHPETGKIEKDKNLARFNIDLLLVLKEKTKNNLDTEEKTFLDSVIFDLQSKFVQA